MTQEPRELHPFIDLTPPDVLPGSWESSDGSYADFRPGNIPDDLVQVTDPKVQASPEASDDDTPSKVSLGETQE
jgi:hypothetical protein